MKSKFGRIGVLAGGSSSEREISLRSGRAVHNALLAEGLDSIFLDVNNNIEEIIKNSCIDVAFIALHGRLGEDGTVQRMLEDAGIPYTGSGVRASALALDKAAAKDIFIKNHIPVPRHVVLTRGMADLDDLRPLKNCFFRHCEAAKRPKQSRRLRGAIATKQSNEIASRFASLAASASSFARNDGRSDFYNSFNLDKLGIPIVVKPHMEGSSIGLSIVFDKKLLHSAIDKAFEYGDKVILEEYIDGRELTVGILDDRPLPVIEIVPKNGVYDYDAKYKDSATKYLVPAPISEDLSKAARELGVMAHKTLGCRSFSRVDMMMKDSGELFVLEINTIPGMTERSLLPKAALVTGLRFNALCVNILENALKGRKE